MSAAAQAAGLSGLDQIRAIFAGETGYEGMVKTLDLHPVSAEEGFVVFEGSPTRAVSTISAARSRPLAFGRSTGVDADGRADCDQLTV